MIPSFDFLRALSVSFPGLVAGEKLLDAFGYIRRLIDHLFRQPLQLIGADGIYVPRPLFRLLQKVRLFERFDICFAQYLGAIGWDARGAGGGKVAEVVGA